MAGQITTSRDYTRTRSRRSFRPNSDINVTPLVDVMLVLLIIFMVAAPMMTVGIPVDLPKTEAAKMNDETEPLVVTLDKKGELYFQETVIPFEQLIERLEAITLHNPEAKVYVRGDKSLPYGKVIEIMGMIAASGLTKVSLITESSQQDPKNSKRKNR